MTQIENLDLQPNILLSDFSVEHKDMDFLFSIFFSYADLRGP